ncbi:MAG: hypothetical protein AAF577_07165 [Pseudomonadota bacterium]
MLDTDPHTTAVAVKRRSTDADIKRNPRERSKIARTEEARRWVVARRQGRPASAPRRLPVSVSA